MLAPKKNPSLVGQGGQAFRKVAAAGIVAQASGLLPGNICMGLQAGGLRHIFREIPGFLGPYDPPVPISGTNPATMPLYQAQETGA